MTKEEHTARAMLLGRVYDHRTNSYWATNMEDTDVDADTLEPLGNLDGNDVGSEIRRRMMAWDAKSIAEDLDEYDRFDI